MSFLTGDLEHPQIIYYENGKKNAIAPKITQKAQKTVRQQVNATFISTLAESAMKAGNVISATDSDGVSIADTMTEKLLVRQIEVQPKTLVIIVVGGHDSFDGLLYNILIDRFIGGNLPDL